MFFAVFRRYLSNTKGHAEAKRGVFSLLVRFPEDIAALI